MKSKIYLSLIFVVVAIVFGTIFLMTKDVQAPQVNNQKTISNIQQAIDNNQNSTDNEKQIQNSAQTFDPIVNALSRITKKPFGIFITPKTSPVQPERFQGYHTGSDLETTLDEQNRDVPVAVLCDGKLLEKKIASGYVGVAIESCLLEGQNVTVVYGHLRLSSIIAKVGNQLKSGEFLGNLGQGFSSETDGERKHLHLAIHKGSSINILGYVQSKAQLSEWLDSARYLQ
ncbi:MAG: peptidoglycan DD-metalloendopeptidase family protein [Candidatus Moraniibacteriota bacterium]